MTIFLIPRKGERYSDNLSPAKTIIQVTTDINFAIMGPAARTIRSQNYNGIYDSEFFEDYKNFKI